MKNSERADDLEKIENENQIDKKKALFFQRFFAFLIDMLLLSFITSIITTPFVDSKKISSLNEKSVEITQKLQKNEIDNMTYLKQYSDIYYKIARSSGIISFVSLLLSVLYFVVFQIYEKGQTLGKKMLKIRVVSLDGDLFMNQMIFRSFIANFILFDIISFGVMLFSPKTVYLYIIIFVEMVQILITLISIIMIMNREDGSAVHDILAHTKVVREN